MVCGLGIFLVYGSGCCVFVCVECFGVGIGEFLVFGRLEEWFCLVFFLLISLWG